MATQVNNATVPATDTIAMAHRRTPRIISPKDLPMRFFDRITERTENYIRSYVIGKLHQRRSRYRLLYRNDMEGLKRALRPGDIILIEGEHWVSDWIKVFSYHTWTHCAMWVGESPTLPAGTDMDFV